MIYATQSTLPALARRQCPKYAEGPGIASSLGCRGSYPSMFEVSLPSVSGGYFDVRLCRLHCSTGSTRHLRRAPLLRFVRTACRLADSSARLGSPSACHANKPAAARPGRSPRAGKCRPRSSSPATEGPAHPNPAVIAFSAGSTGRDRRHPAGAPARAARTVLTAIWR